MVAVITPEQRVLYTQRLAEAEGAYHSIMTGGGVKVVVDQNGERVEYQQANVQRLSAYIAWLKGQLGIGSGLGPLNVWF